MSNFSLLLKSAQMAHLQSSEAATQADKYSAPLHLPLILGLIWGMSLKLQLLHQTLSHSIRPLDVNWQLARLNFRQLSSNIPYWQRHSVHH